MKKKSLTVKDLDEDLLRSLRISITASGKKTPQWISEAILAKIPPQYRPEPKKAKVAGK